MDFSRRSAAVLSATVLLIAPAAFGCVCVTPPLKYAFKKSTYMFVGRVNKVETGPGIRVTATVDVDETFRGQLGPVVQIQTSSEGCGVFFEVGKKYFVDARTDETDRVSTTASLCSATTEWTAGGEEKARLVRSRRWWWRLPFSYPGRYPIHAWYYRHF
jgi:hypothetical protein